MAVQTRLDECLSIRDGLLVQGDQAEWIERPEPVAEVFVRDLVPARLRGPR